MYLEKAGLSDSPLPSCLDRVSQSNIEWLLQSWSAKHVSSHPELYCESLSKVIKQNSHFSPIHKTNQILKSSLSYANLSFNFQIFYIHYTLTLHSNC